MKVDVDTLPPTGDTFTLTLAGADVLQQWGQTEASRDLTIDCVDATVHLQPHMGGVELNGQVRLRGQVLCGRCLAPLKLDVTDAVRVRFERFRPQPAELELNEAAFDVEEFDGETVDLAAWVAEQAALLLPEHPRCQDLLGQPCSAEAVAATAAKIPARPDPRWAGLQGLLKPEVKH